MPQLDLYFDSDQSVPTALRHNYCGVLKESCMKIVLKLAAFLLLSCPANAKEVEVSTGVVCNTQKQIERFIALIH
jgi:hypothetical protein